MADISFLSIKIFVEVSKIWKNGKRVLYVVLKILSYEKIKNILPFPFNLKIYLYVLHATTNSQFTSCDFRYKLQFTNPPASLLIHFIYSIYTHFGLSMLRSMYDPKLRASTSYLSFSITFTSERVSPNYFSLILLFTTQMFDKHWCKNLSEFAPSFFPQETTQSSPEKCSQHR